MAEENDYSSKKDADNKNIEMIFCTFCPSTILQRHVATFVNKEFPLPYIHSKEDKSEKDHENIEDYWMLEDINSFENIGVSKTVGNIKYLACADCEKGPVGWYDIESRKSYIALSRVRHQNEKPART